MFQIAGGSIGLGLNTAIVTTSSSLTHGISNAFQVDTVLAACGLAISIAYVGGKPVAERVRAVPSKVFKIGCF